MAIARAKNPVKHSRTTTLPSSMHAEWASAVLLNS